MLYWVPPGPEGPKNAVLITPSGTSYDKLRTVIFKEQLPEVSKRKIELLNFTIEKTKAPLVVRASNTAAWRQAKTKWEGSYKMPRSRFESDWRRK